MAMDNPIWAALGLAFAVAGSLLVRAFWRLRGTHLVTCPETGRPAAVELDLPYAVTSSAFGPTRLRLSECSRWPERRRCGQACLSDLEEAPENCLLREIVGRYYEGRSCAFCGRPFDVLHWHDHKPALVDDEQRTFQWNELRPEELPEALRRCRPVCWNCHIAESFRREHPDLVVERPRLRRRPAPRPSP
jgi:hypothetical protein